MCDDKKLSVEEGVQVIEREMSGYLTDEDRTKEHVLGYNCTMVSAVKD